MLVSILSHKRLGNAALIKRKNMTAHGTETAET
jgi:hypothetical protein